MAKYRNMFVVVAFVEFIAAGLIAGAGGIGCVGTGRKVEQLAGARASAFPYMVCRDMPSACSP